MSCMCLEHTQSLTCSSKIFCKNYHYKLQIKQMKFEKWADLAGVTGRRIRHLGPEDAAPSVYKRASVLSPLESENCYFRICRVNKCRNGKLFRLWLT